MSLPVADMVFVFCFVAFVIFLILHELSKSKAKMIRKRPEDENQDDVWFDGVNKKLLKMNSVQPRLVEGNDKSLLTRKPLVKFPAIKSSKTKKPKTSDTATTNSNSNKRLKVATIKPNTGITDELAIDCEMVECANRQSVLARVSIVNLFGHPIYDQFVAPPSKVVDYRTRWSGIRKKDLEGAPDFDSVRSEVAAIIKDKIVVGHAIHNDFGVLKINHPSDKTRDTSQYFKYLFQGRTPSLKKLSESLLGVKIQKGEHDSVQDAQATMKLYVKERDKWNDNLKHNIYHHPSSDWFKKRKSNHLTNNRNIVKEAIKSSISKKSVTDKLHKT